MKAKLAALLIGGVLVTAAQTGLVASADEANPAAIALLPFKMVSAVTGAAIGAPYGGVKGIWEMEEKVFEDQDPVDANVWMWPVNIGKAALAAPVGFLIGVPKGMATGAKAGLSLWDNE